MPWRNDCRGSASQAPSTGRLYDMSALGTWEPTDQSAWARALGLVNVPLFSRERESDWPGSSSVLLDGRKSSFVVYCTEDPSVRYDPMPVSWAWSSNVRHALIIDTAAGDMLLRRWDSTGDRRFRIPERVQAAHDLLSLLESTPPPQSPDVILHMLRVFRRLRADIRSDNPLDAVRLFDALLAGAEAIHKDPALEQEWTKARTVADALAPLSKCTLADTEIDQIDERLKTTDIRAVLDSFLRPEPQTGSHLDTALLLRHAAGQLYQEAHIVLEKEPQLSFPGLADDRATRGTLRRDVRFTPTTLARLLVQQALDSADCLKHSSSRVEILDPACGSGVFLQEALRELELRRFRGKAILRGFDVSPVSCAIARFCLSRAGRDARACGIEPEVTIEEADALQHDWGSPDVILMNPPFVPWPTMSLVEQSVVKEVLGQLVRGRADKAMAFIWAATQALKPGAAVASVLPTPLLETASGNRWREALLSAAHITSMGRFQGFGFFRESLVEPSWIVLRRPQEPKEPRPKFRVLLSSSGGEEAAIRALRRDDPHPAPSDQWELLDVAPDRMSSGSWLPRSGRHAQLIEHLADTRVTRVSDLFAVHQGVRTGRKHVFVLNEKDMQELPPEERLFFRPAATSSTIEDGCLRRKEYLFYPYGKSGLLLETERKLSAQVPEYYRRWLLPAKPALCARNRTTEQNWWTLAEERHWQYEPRPKLVTKYFGGEGSFAFDASGDFVVVQGFAWLPKSRIGDALPFESSSLPYAYLALTNSAFFHTLLSWFCPRLAGGQFDLSPRFVNNAFLPDLSDESVVSGDLVDDLVWLGKQIHEGRIPPPQVLMQTAERAYGIA